MITCIANQAIDLLDQNACRAWWLRRLHPAGAMCPACGVSLPATSTGTWADGGLVNCRDCGKWYDYKTGTPLCGLHLSWQQLTLFVTLFQLGLKTSQLARYCQISDDTVRRLVKRLGVGLV